MDVFVTSGQLVTQPHLAPARHECALNGADHSWPWGSSTCQSQAVGAAAPHCNCKLSLGCECSGQAGC